MRDTSVSVDIIAVERAIEGLLMAVPFSAGFASVGARVAARTSVAKAPLGKAARNPIVGLLYFERARCPGRA
jgi:hypothetical protein